MFLKHLFFTAISLVDSLPEVIDSPTSQSNEQELLIKYTLQVNSTPLIIESEKETKSEEIIPTELIKSKVVTPTTTPTATELLSASIEAVAAKATKESPSEETEVIETEVSSVSEAQAKLNQSLVACSKVNQTDSIMKDIITTNNKKKG